MKYSDFIHMSVKGDGACFFHSIAAILNIEENTLVPLDQPLNITIKNRTKLAIELRKECVKWLRTNLDYKIKGLERSISQEIQSEIDDGGLNNKVTNVNKYLTYMSRHDSYAGQIEIYAMSNLLNRNIRVYIHNKGKFSNVGLGYEVKKKDIMNDIFLYHNLGKTKSEGSHHFEALYPKVKAKADVKRIKNKSIKPIRKSLRKSTRKSKRRSTRKSHRRSHRISKRKYLRKSTRKSNRKPRGKSERKSRKPRRRSGRKFTRNLNI